MPISQRHKSKLSRKISTMIIVACLSHSFFSSDIHHQSSARSVVAGQPDSGGNDNFDWQIFLEPDWRANLSIQDRINKLNALFLQLAGSEKSKIWMGLLIFQPDGMTVENLPSLFSIFSKCGASPAQLSRVAEKQWIKMLSICLEDEGNTLSQPARLQLIQSLLPSSLSSSIYNSKAVADLIALYHHQKTSGGIDSPGSMYVMGALLKTFALNIDSSQNGVEIEVETDILNSMTAEQSELLKYMPDVPDGVDKINYRDLIVRLKKKLVLLEQCKGDQGHTRQALAAVYFSLHEFAQAEALLKLTLDEAQKTVVAVPSFDQNAKFEVVIPALCLAKISIAQGNLESAKKNLDIAKQILPSLSNDFCRGWEPAIIMIEAEISKASGNTTLAKAQYELANSQLDVQRISAAYEWFLVQSPCCRIILPDEQTILQEWIGLLKSENQLKLAEEKSSTLRNITDLRTRSAAETSLRAKFNLSERELNYCDGSEDNFSVDGILRVVRESSCKNSFKLVLIERSAKSLIEHSRFTSAIDLINASLKEPELITCDDFDIHSIYLQQMKIRAEVGAGKFQQARLDCAEFLAKPENANPRLRNQRLDVRGWQARIELLSGKPEIARNDLEQLCKEWNKDGTNVLLSDFREHLRDLSTAYFELHEYELAARALRYYLKERSYTNNSKSYEVRSLLGRCYQQLGNVGLAEPLIEQVVSSIPDSSDDIEKVYAIATSPTFISTQTINLKRSNIIDAGLPY